MHGGGFNRIVGISVASSESPTAIQYVLRVPRFDAARLDHDLAPLQLLRRRSKIKVPEVIAFNTTSHNVLESPYMIQTRIPGSPLFPAYPDLPYDMKRDIAYELRRVFSELNSIRSFVAGRLTLSPSQGRLRIQPFNNMDPDATVLYENGPAAQKPSDMLLALFEYEKELAVAEGPKQSFRFLSSTHSLLWHQR